jgi:CheY-like chemotaxis protein
MHEVLLHVEDEENDRLLLQLAMTKAGIENPVQAATDGQQAMDYLKGTGKFADRSLYPLPCLVLLDLKLPRVPGLEVLKWIRQEARLNLPVLVLTSSQNDNDIAAAYDLGANAYLVKPSDTFKLAAMATAMKEFWLTQNTPPPKSRPTGTNGAGDLLQPLSASFPLL